MGSLGFQKRGCLHQSRAFMSGRVHDDVVGRAGGSGSFMASRLMAYKGAQLTVVMNRTSSSSGAFGWRSVIGIIARGRRW